MTEVDSFPIRRFNCEVKVPLPTLGGFEDIAVAFEYMPRNTMDLTLSVDEGPVVGFDDVNGWEEFVETLKSDYGILELIPRGGEVRITRVK